MKILLSASQLGDRGTPRTLANYARLLEFGHDIAVYGWDIGGQTAEELQNEGYLVFIGRKDLGKALAFKPDIFNLHRGGARHKDEKELLELFKNQGAKCVETNVFGRYDSSVDSLLDLSIQISLWDLYRWNAWKGKSPVKGVYLPNPVDTSEFRRVSNLEIEAKRRSWGIEPSENVFIIGRIAKIDWECLYRPLHEVLNRHPNVRFVTVAGRDNCERLSNHPQIITQPKMRGPRELSAFYSSCDICISISKMGESFGCANAEAMACETPVLALSTPLRDNSQVEMVRDMIGGRVIGTMKDFPRAVEYFMKDIARTREMGRHARELIVSRFGFEWAGKRLNHIMKSVIDSDIMPLLEDEFREYYHSINLKSIHVGFMGRTILFCVKLLHTYYGGLIVRIKHSLRVAMWNINGRPWRK